MAPAVPTRIAAQCQYVMNTRIRVGGDHRTQFRDGRADTREMAHGRQRRFVGDLLGDGHGAITRGAAGPVRHRHQIRVQWFEPADGVPQVP